MDILLQTLAFIITILVLVSIHEAGHFIVAKLLGVKVIRYSIGFGKAIFRYRGKSGTEYIIGFIPLGGYVKLLDEREVVVPQSELHAAFNRQPLWARALIVLAGPFTNFLFAVLAFWLMFMIGIEVLRPITGEIVPNSIAAQAGLQSNELITKVDGHITPSLQKVVIRIIERIGETSTLSIQTRSANQYTDHLLNLHNWSVNALNPDPLQSLGIVPPRPFIPAIIDTVEELGPAAMVGLKAGDKILAFNNKPIKDWYQLLTLIQQNPSEKVTLTFERAGKIATMPIIVGHKLGLRFKKVGYLGVKAKIPAIPENLLTIRKYSPGVSFKIALSETWEYLLFNVIIIKKMILGQISLNTLGGPIAIFQTADLAFQQGVSIFLGFLGLISIMLGFINLLPIPGLDGGHLLNYLIELIIRRPLSIQYEIISVRIGFIILLTIMVIATFNDLLRLFTS